MVRIFPALSGRGWFAAPPAQEEFHSFTTNVVATPSIPEPELPKPEEVATLNLLDVVSEKALSDYSVQRARAEKLKALGFSSVADPLLTRIGAIERVKAALGTSVSVVTVEAIQKFLAKANKRQSKREGGVLDPEEAKQFGGLLGHISAHYTGYSTYRFYTIWKEVKVSEYKGVPPDHVLDRLADVMAKGCFDYFTIASVENFSVQVKDPLLLGRFNGLEDRFYLSQWGDDVCLDDLI